MRDQVAALRNGAGGGNGAGGVLLFSALPAASNSNNLAVAGGTVSSGPSAEKSPSVADELEKRSPKFEMLGMNVGGTDTGDATFTGKGRYFGTFGQHYAVQSEGEYFYSKGRRGSSMWDSSIAWAASRRTLLELQARESYRR